MTDMWHSILLCDIMLIPNSKSKIRKINRKESENKKINKNKSSSLFLTLTTGLVYISQYDWRIYITTYKENF